MRADPPPINALGTVNADHVFADVQLSAGIWHHKPGFQLPDSISPDSPGIGGGKHEREKRTRATDGTHSRGHKRQGSHRRFSRGV